jgi:EmrB/QacA subfamily drug resistance transporter
MAPASRTTHRLLVTVCVILAMFMAAIEVTIVATAMPAIVGQLGNFSLYTWVFSAFLLTQAATIIMFGRLADLYSRRPVLIAGISVFLLGSVLCGLARSMMMLIIFRLIQGLGAGSIQPVAMTIIGDLYTLDERAKIQGYLASVWGVAAIIGPLAGGFIVQVISWPWIFWINVPIGLITIAGVLLFLHENVEHRQRRIDYLGSLLFGGAVAAFLLVLTQGGTQWPWASMEMIALAATFVGCLVLLLLHERRTPEPMIALDMWTNRLMASANSTVLVAGMMLIGITSFLPMYVQGVMGRSAIVAGFTLTIMSVGWPLGSALSSRFFGRLGTDGTARFGGILLVIGAAFFLFLTPQASPALAGVGSFVMGFGMGLINTTCIVLIQGSVEWSKRGSATASNVFARILGNTLGAAALGGLLNTSLQSYFQASAVGFEHLNVDSIHQLLENSAGQQIAGENEVILAALEHSLHYTFVGVLVLAVVAGGLTLRIPRRVAEAQTEIRG